MTTRKTTGKPKPDSKPTPESKPRANSKPKPTTSPLIEWPTKEELQLPVTVEHKEPARAGEAWPVGTERPMAWSSPQRGKMIRH